MGGRDEKVSSGQVDLKQLQGWKGDQDERVEDIASRRCMRHC